MNKIICLFVIIFIVLSFSCKKKKVAEKADGLWYVTTIQNKYNAIANAGTIEFDSSGSGAFNLNYYNPESRSQVVDTRDFKWDNSKNTLTIKFSNGSGALYYKIDHLSKTQFIITSGDYLLGTLTLNRP